MISIRSVFLIECIYYILYFLILYNSIDCKCNETVRDGYGMCRKRSSRLGGNFFCAVDDDSKCKDLKKEPKTGISVSVDACKNTNVGKVPSDFRFHVLM